MSNRTTIVVSKEEAKKMIDASPADKICVTIIDVENHVSGDTEFMKKLEGYALIDAANKVDYENHCIFGRLDLMGVLQEKKSLMHCITFAQGSPPDEKFFS